MKLAFKTIVIGFIFCLWCFLFYNFILMQIPELRGTYVAFQSSDGQWGDNEVLTHGRNFRTIAVLFEYYKIKCNVPDVTLQRITKKPEGFSFRGMFNNYSDPKWLVPLAANLPNKETGYFEPACSRNRGIFPEEAKLAHERADAYIDQLKTQNSNAKSGE